MPARARRTHRRTHRVARDAPKAAGPKQRRFRAGRLGLAVLLCLAGGALAFYLSLPSVAALEKTNPKTTALIEARAAEAREHGRAARRNQHWVPLGRISPWLVNAVVNSEDARFYLHDGIDPIEIGRAAETAFERGRLGRGASTLTQQLAKNLWLGEERSLLRKLKEVVLAHRLEALGKDRILELYLNVVEWGDGIYGADAASRVWFKKPASQILPEEAAVLAAMLPAPRKRNPARPSARLRQRSYEILRLFQVYKELPPEGVEQAREALSGLVGPP
ncbi:MAG TPA: monofunctional biosynthetic peptidoglycan transglycosylase [Myxococcales bacterium]|jgi:monofunctional biosynthetic peptidoglycan transglycosylase